MDINENLTNRVPGGVDVEALYRELDPFPLGKIRIPTRREERELAKKQRKMVSLRHRKPYTRKRGTVHPNKKKPLSVGTESGFGGKPRFGVLFMGGEPMLLTERNGTGILPHSGRSMTRGT